MFKGGIGCSGEERGREKNKTRPIHARPRSVFPPVNRAADENAIKRKGTAEGITRLARVTSRVYIHIYIYIVGRFSSVHHGCIREISRQDVYTYISFKQETHYLCWPSFFNAADIYSRIRRGDELTPTLVFNKAETRIVKLNLNCVIIQVSLSLSRFVLSLYLFGSISKFDSRIL